MPNPDIVGNVGCFFKSPIVTDQKATEIEASIPNAQIFSHKQGYKKISAGDLIKACGWAGKRVGDVGVDAKRPIVLLNHGTQSGLEIYDLYRKIQRDVELKFNVKLEPEVVIE
ncbi:UDP-N-acetylenolpyruvoylglucosamine reductase [compost metagenome]